MCPPNGLEGAQDEFQPIKLGESPRYPLSKEDLDTGRSQAPEQYSVTQGDFLICLRLDLLSCKFTGPEFNQIMPQQWLTSGRHQKSPSSKRSISDSDLGRTSHSRPSHPCYVKLAGRQAQSVINVWTPENCFFTLRCFQSSVPDRGCQMVTSQLPGSTTNLAGFFLDPQIL